MVVFDNNEHDIETKRTNLQTSLARYQLAIIHKHTSELPFLLSQIKINQQHFERAYKIEHERNRFYTSRITITLIISSEGGVAPLLYSLEFPLLPYDN